MYLDGWVAELNAPADALGKWSLMAKIYPDSMPAIANTANRLIRAGRWTDAMAYANRATAPQSDVIAFGFDQLGRSLMALGDEPKAATAFARAHAGGNRESLLRRAEVAAVQRRFKAAGHLLDGMSTPDPSLSMERMTFAIDEGRWDQARMHAEAALRLLDKQRNRYGFAVEFGSAVTDYLEGDSGAAMRRNRTVANDALSSLKTGTSADAEEVVGIALTAALLGQQLGDRALATQVLAALQDNPEVRSPKHAELAAVVRAQELRLAGRPQDALAKLKPLLTGQEAYQTHLALMDAYAAAGDNEAALQQARWLQGRRGLAYAELTGYQCQQSWNAAISTLAFLRAAELLSHANRAEEARQALASFDQRWAPEQLPRYLRNRRADVLSASSRGGL
jgi:tetratricopeptide (TPR) repeat protein